MASNTITFDPDSGVPYGANLTIYGGTDFAQTFNVGILQVLLLILQITLDQRSYLNRLVLEHQLVVATILPFRLV